MSVVRVFASLILLCTVLRTPAKSDEVFLCADDTLLYVDSSNRACLRDHPCVRRWFSPDTRQSRAAATDIASPNRQPASLTQPLSPPEPDGKTAACPVGPANIEKIQTRSGAIEIVLPMDGSISDAPHMAATVVPYGYSAAQGGGVGTYSGGGGGPRTVHVRAYVRKDGTFVRAHTRSAPGSGSGRSRR